jgi:hypothetical protein
MGSRRRVAFVVLLSVGALLCASMLAPAFGAPKVVSAASLASKVAKALKLSKRADRNAQRALANSRKPDPAGPLGAADDRPDRRRLRAGRDHRAAALHGVEHLRQLHQRGPDGNQGRLAQLGPTGSLRLAITGTLAVLLVPA